jgi:hypothetical protein
VQTFRRRAIRTASFGKRRLLIGLLARSGRIGVYHPQMDLRVTVELLQTMAAAVAATRLIYLNLARQFPALTAYLVFLAAINLDFGLLNRASPLYAWSYVFLEPLKWIFSIYAVRELFALTFNSYPGIRTVGRWAMYSGVALALSISLLLTRFFWGHGARGHSAPLFYFEVSQRSVVFTLAVVVVAILLSLSKYPLHLNKNALVSSIFFSVLFLSEACRLLVDTLAPRLFNDYVDWSEAIFISICLIGWAAMLRPEPATAPARITFSAPQEEHLLQQLNALNQMMTRAARR